METCPGGKTKKAHEGHHVVCPIHGLRSFQLSPFPPSIACELSRTEQAMETASVKSKENTESPIVSSERSCTAEQTPCASILALGTFLRNEEQEKVVMETEE